MFLLYKAEAHTKACLTGPSGDWSTAPCTQWELVAVYQVKVSWVSANSRLSHFAPGCFWDLRSVWRGRRFPLLPVSPGLARPRGQCISFLPFPEGCVWGYAGEREENVPLESCSLPLADPVSALQDGRKHIQPFLCQSFLALRLSSQRASSCFLKT